MMKRLILVAALAAAPSFDVSAQPAPAAATTDKAAPAPAPTPPAGSAAGSATGSATGSNAAAGSAAVPAAGSNVSPPAPPAPPPTTSDEPPMTGDAAELRKTCAAAMNADPAFADAIIKTAERKTRDKVNLEQIDKDLCKVKFHTDAQEAIAKNEKHVILAYAAMWILAIGFVVYLWRRQQRLTAEILQLRKELEAAEKEASK